MENRLKLIVINEIKRRQGHYPSQNQMSKALGLSASQLSKILNGQYQRVLSDDNFMRIAHELGVDLHGSNWKTAVTPTFDMVVKQLATCQDEGISAILVDAAGVGKTHAARDFSRNNKNVVYVDCSQVKTKQLLVRDIARKFGLTHTGRYADVYNNLVYSLKSGFGNLIILDEAGDLAYPAFLELKALWNATEGLVGWYMMGADGLKSKINRNIDNSKVGYTELFRRFGERFQQVTPFGKEETENFKRSQLAIVARANGMTEVQKLYAKTSGSLTRLKIEYLKKKRIENLEKAK